MIHTPSQKTTFLLLIIDPLESFKNIIKRYKYNFRYKKCADDSTNLNPMYLQCPEVEPDISLYLRACHPCREKLETLQVEAYQESLQEGDETADCMARMIQMHKGIVVVQHKLEAALPEVSYFLEILYENRLY